MEWTAAAWTAGSVVGCGSGLPWWFWLVVMLAASPWLVAASMRRSMMMTALMVACLLLSAGRAARATQVVASTDIRCWMGASQSGPARLRLQVGSRRGDGRRWCVVLAWDELDRFNPRTFHSPERSRCDVDKQAQRGIVFDTTIQPSTSRWHTASGQVLLRADGIALTTGSTIDASGRCRTGLGRDGRLATFEVFRTTHIRHVDSPPLWRRWVDEIRSRVCDVLSAPPLHGGHTRSMVSTIVLGHRDGLWNEVSRPFRTTGTAHLLAVSGLHLAVLCGIALTASRWCGTSIRRGSVMVVLVTAIMLVVAQVRTPLARAGLMVLVAAGLSSLRWRMSAGSVLALAAIAIEIENPRAVVDIGFQLSFTVVAALIYLFPAWSRRVAVVGIQRSAFVESTRATTTAWLVATPIAAHHFGMYSLLGIPATLLLFPMVAGILVIGYLRILLSAWVLASDGGAHVLNVVASVLWSSVLLLDRMPGSGIDIASPSWAWVIAAEMAGFDIMLGNRRTTRLLSGLGLVVLWLVASTT